MPSPRLAARLMMVALAISMVACERQAPPIVTAPPSAASHAVEPAAPPAPAGPVVRKPYESMPPAPPHEPTPLPDLSEIEPGEPAPKAGRQVLRCTEHGRTVYMDLNSSCREGEGQRVTVFPTQGVEKPR